MTDVIEHPTLFKPDMVRAILDDRKLQTRRVCTARNSYMDGWPFPRGVWEQMAFERAWVDKGPSPAGNPGPYLKAPWPQEDDETVHRIYSRVQVGDRLWVKETWQAIHVDTDPETGYGDDVRHAEKIPKNDLDGFWGVAYAASDPEVSSTTEDRGFPWRPSIFMPRWASRITLEVTDVRVQRINEISGRDIRAEGVDPSRPNTFGQHANDPLSYAFQVLWDGINAKRGFGWKTNPWVWAYTFKRIGA
jgi:hypothetical protein